MKRMICIGAQSVDVSELAVPLPGVKMLCRRDSGPAQLRIYLRAHAIDLPATAQVQLSLFEEAVA